jgi:general secretion pathway protein G
MLSRFSRKTHAGFTLVEMLLVLTILGILAGLVVPGLAKNGERARKTAAAAQIAIFDTALDHFEIDNGYYPKGKNGLNDLLQPPRDAQNWKGPYLKKNAIPLDPWHTAYIYECPGKHNTYTYDLSSAGPDMRAGTEDDIGNWLTTQ